MILLLGDQSKLQCEVHVSRYSQLYIDQSSPLPDSARARLRLGKLLEKITDKKYNVGAFSEFLEGELGVSVNVGYASHWPRFFSNCTVRDVLDCITLVKNYLTKSHPYDSAKGAEAARLWQQEARRVFTEERLAYEIDDNDLVHPAIDKEFQRNRQTTVSGLQTPRYSISLAAFERVSNELTSQPPNGKEAWRSVFAAVEGLFRLMFQSAPQLNAGAIEANLTGLIQKLYGPDAVALRAANKQLASFKDWVDSSHNYRHEPGSAETVQPPIDLAVLAISNGTAFLRWLIVLDQANGGKS